MVFRSFQAENLKRLNLSLYFELNYPASRRAYRFLDKRFYRSNILQFNLRDFACEHVGFSRNYTAAKIKEKLQPAIDELERAGFLEPMSRAERYQGTSRGEWRITLVRKLPDAPGATRRAERSTVLTPEVPELSPAEKALIERGITPPTATELVRASSADQVLAQVEIFDWLTEKKDRRISKSPAGYLADSIRKGYTGPKGFESKADRTRRLEAEQLKARRAEEAKRRTEAAALARDEAERARIAAYWEARSGPERESLRAEALAKANPFFLQQYRRNKDEPATAERYLEMILHAHITTILDERRDPGRSTD